MPKAPIIADSAEPKSIAELQGHQLNVIPCEKGAKASTSPVARHAFSLSRARSSRLVYNVAIPSERGAIEAVMAVLPNGKGAVVKVKSMLVERVYRGLKMKPGNVLAGARSRSKKPAAP